MALQEICQMLDTYRGRDKVLRILCYSTKLIGGIAKDEATARKFHIFSSQMSKTRAVLRLLDDLPMLQYNLDYGLGRSESDAILATLGVTTNLIDQIYYPIEKIAWLAENRLISVADAGWWDTLSSMFWVASIYLSLMKSVRHVDILRKHRLKVNSKNDEMFLRKLSLAEKMELLSCLRLSMDFVHAVSTLPPGFLWSGKLQTWHVGLIATLSSALGMYQLFAKRHMA